MAGHIPRTPLDHCGVSIHNDGRLYILDDDDRRIYGRLRTLCGLIRKRIASKPQSATVKMENSAFLRKVVIR